MKSTSWLRPLAGILLMAFFSCSLPRAGRKSTMMHTDTLIMQPGAVPQLVANTFAFTEGPAADRTGNVYFTDQPNNRIWKWAPDGRLSVFLEPSGRANGMFFDNRGNLLACADEQNEIWSIAPNGQVQVLMQPTADRRMNGPNDLWSDPSGGIYFTDPYYQRPWWQHKTAPQPSECLYYLPAGASVPVLVDSAFKKPNGIVGTPDNRYLYVADIGDGKTYRYEIAGAGLLRNRMLFAPMGSDGMTLDNRGNLYLTGKGVTVYSAAGARIAHIPVPEPWTANVCFGGTERNQLFITASKSVYTLDMLVKGAW